VQRADTRPADREADVTRRTRSASVLAFVLTTLWLTAGPALANVANHPIGPSEREDPGDSLTAAETIGLFILLPVAIIALISAVTWLPGAVRGARYRPNEGWAAPPVWFAGPPAPMEALAAAQGGNVADVTRGGASGNW
jgi:hypothetical protein